MDIHPHKADSSICMWAYSGGRLAVTVLAGKTLASFTYRQFNNIFTFYVFLIIKITETLRKKCFYSCKFVYKSHFINNSLSVLLYFHLRNILFWIC